MGWGTSWDKPKSTEVLEEAAAHGWPEVKPEEIGKQLRIRVPEDFKIIDNKFPTHDPYANPNAFLYYECECGARLDPRTKSFASLNNAASNANWKVRWGPNSYVPYCPKCVEEKGIE